jgi:oligo-1,6-glucosidase
MTDITSAVIYQIYPRSFADSNGDGIGDLRGIIQRLDYLADLGVDVLWLSPIFQSPNADNGYDVSDYEAIQPEFGTMTDLDELLAEAHQRGLRVLLDLVVNHSSDEHRWFRESRKSRDNPYRDYYIWRAEPNDWQSFFSGSAWTLDDTTGEYYLHLFAEKQPDLNWESPALRQEIYRMMRFWLDKGVDGFRMDVIPFLSKDQQFPNYPEGRFGDLTIHANGPRIHGFLQEMHWEVLRHYPNAMTIAEGFGVTAEQANLYVGADRHELQMIYHFDHAVPREECRFLDPAPELTLPELKAIFDRWNQALGDDPVTSGWQNIYFGNHDNPRVLSRFGGPIRYHYESATCLATILLTQRGTPNIYQGDEIGMQNYPFTSISEFDDIQVRNAWNALVMDSSGGADPDKAARFMAAANRIARDHARTPMQWTDAPNAGFSTGTPWLRVNPEYERVNVAAQANNPNSVLAFYRRLLRWRRGIPALHTGTCRDLLPDHPTLWAFARTLAGDAFVTVANLSATETALPDEVKPGEIVFGNYPDPGAASRLRPYEVVVFRTMFHT